MFEPPESGTGANLTESLFHASLPEARCTACGRTVARRKHRVAIRCSWRPAVEILCPGCWAVICQWAVRFAQQQGILDLA
jgi:hypothetical protein